jgi:hypothetical protein
MLVPSSAGIEPSSRIPCGNRQFLQRLFFELARIEELACQYIGYSKDESLC